MVETEARLDSAISYRGDTIMGEGTRDKGGSRVGNGGGGTVTVEVADEIDAE